LGSCPTNYDYILVNIPEFKLHAYENGNYAFDMVVVVVARTHNTVIFTGILKCGF
jgi:murein L,D-transpeptidase YcbB/YkuD